MKFWLLFCLVPGILAQADPDFLEADYENQDRWGGECNTGLRQTPVHIFTKYLKPNRKLRPIKFHNYDTKYKAEVDRTVKVQLTADKKDLPWVSGGGEKYETFRFDNIHIHWGWSKYRGSEHLVDDNRYAGEIHIVHYNTKYDGVESALESKDSNALLVLGFFFEVSKKDNPAWDTVIRAADSVPYGSDDKVTLLNFELSDLLTRTKPKDYYHYRGSLTTPGCNEVVSWYVYDKTVPISDKQLNILKTLTDSTGNKLTLNYRDTQPLNGRKIEYYKASDKYDKEGPGHHGGYEPHGHGGEPFKPRGAFGKHHHHVPGGKW